MTFPGASQLHRIALTAPEQPARMFGAMFGGFAAGSFSAQYRVYPVSFLDKLEAENGDKIFLPPSALDRLGTCFA